MNKINLIITVSSLGILVGCQVAHAMHPVDVCEVGKVAKASAGYMCRAGSVMWRVENDIYAGKRVYQDMKSGLKVTEPLDNHSDSSPYDGHSSQDDAESLCKDGYRLPTGYPSIINGQDGFAERDSDFTILESDGVRQVVPGMEEDWFWSSSVHPENTDYAFYFNGSDGYFGFVFRGSGYGATVCVAGY